MKLLKDQGKIWAQHKIEFPDPPPNFCAWARQFQDWVSQLIDDTQQDLSEIKLNQSLLLLQKAYWAWYERVPVAHKNLIGARDGHVCIWQVYKESYAALRELELTRVSRPRFFDPPTAPRPPQIAGVFIGEEPGELE